MAEINDFDITDANNTARWPEGMPFAGVNDAARADEGILARFYKDVNGSLVTTGAANAYAVAANQTFTAYYTGMWVKAKANFSNTGAATVNIDALGVKSLVKGVSTALETGDIVSGKIYDFIYDGTNMQVLQLPASLTAALAGTAPLTLRRTENDTTEREIVSLQLGSGAGNKGSLRVVGTGANDVTEIRAYVAATEVARLTAALLKAQVNFQIGASIVVNAVGGYTDLSEVSAPAAPAADTARMYARDLAGTTILAMKDSVGAETILGLAVASQAEQEAAASLTRAVAPGVQQFHPGHPKVWAYVTVSGGVPTVQASYNLTGIVDNGVGDITFTIATDFNSVNWCGLCTCQGASSNQEAWPYENDGRTAGTIQYQTQGDTGASPEPRAWNFMGLGDQ